MTIYENICKTVWNYRDLQKEGCQGLSSPTFMIPDPHKEDKAHWLLSFNS